MIQFSFKTSYSMSKDIVYGNVKTIGCIESLPISFNHNYLKIVELFD